MNDPYQTRQFFNMRPETTIKLRRIIKEEIRSAIKEGVLGAEDAENQFMKNLIDKAEGKLSRSEKGNRFRVPGSDKLPEKRTDVNYRDDNKPSISLPSITSSGTTRIYSKEDADNWVDEFVKLFGAPKFIVSGEKIEVENPKFKAHRELYAPAIQKDKGYEPKNEEFKRMQELAGIVSENEGGFPSENEIKEKSKTGGWVTISKNGVNYDVNYTVSSYNDNEMSFGVYLSGESEDSEQVEEFTTYNGLSNWFNNTHRSKVDWYYVNEDSDYPGPKGRVIPVAAGYEDPTRFEGTELYIPAETEGYVEGTSFFDEEGNDVPFDEQYFEKI